jgi:hypothetical protein
MPDPTAADLDAARELFAAEGRSDVPELLLEAAAGIRSPERRAAFVASLTPRVIDRAKALSTPQGRLWLLLEDQMAEALDGLFRERVRRKCHEEM